MTLIKDKVALITGAAAGIGAGVARLFAEQGAHVFLVDINADGVKDTAAALQRSGFSAFPFEADVRRRETLVPAVEEALHRSGRLDILINNAGIYPRQPFLEMSEQQWDEIQDINLKGMFQCAKLVLPHMVKGRAGHIVNISSVTFFIGMKNLTHYIASKGAVIGFTRALAREVGEYNVHVNCITPGAVETEGEKAVATQEQIEAILKLQSLQRRIVPLDIAKACLFLCSDLAVGITGQTINVDGGWVMH
jgi:3-oxoacyl-[acyl-carrier protein] reductase